MHIVELNGHVESFSTFIKRFMTNNLEVVMSNKTDVGGWETFGRISCIHKHEHTHTQSHMAARSAALFAMYIIITPHAIICTYVRAYGIITSNDQRRTARFALFSYVAIGIRNYFVNYCC